MPARRPALAAALASVALASVLCGPVAPAAAEGPSGSTALRERVAALQADVDRVGGALEEGSRAWEQGQRRLGVLTQQESAVGARLDAEHVRTGQRQSGVDALVRAAYEDSGLPPTVTALLSGDLRALADLDRMRDSVARADSASRADLAALVQRRTAALQLLERQAGLRRQALAQRQELDARQRALSAEAVRLSTRLTGTAAALEGALAAEAQAARRDAAARAAAAAAAAAARATVAVRAAAAASATGVPGALSDVGPATAAAVGYAPGVVAGGSGGGCAPAVPHGYANGFLPDAVLCPLPGRPGARLRTDAAQSFVALDAARTAQGLPPLCVTDSYRDYAGQLDVYARKPQLAAVPGRSQHGWGLALDLCGGVQVPDGEAHRWLQANAARFGWVHPGWAEPGGSRPEAWHWEFQG